MRFAILIFILARAMPIVRIKRPILSFCSAKTCSTRERTIDLRVRWRDGRRRESVDPSTSCDGMRLTKPFFTMRPHWPRSDRPCPPSRTPPYWSFRVGPRVAARLRSGGVGRRPFADEAEAFVDRDMVLIAENRDGDVDRRLCSVRPFLRLAELHGPAVRNAALLDHLLLVLSVSLCFGAATRVASTIWPDMAI